MKQGDDAELPEVRLTQEELGRVLDRAVRLDAEGVPEVSLAELQAIARDVDISPKALELAVAEVVRARGEGAVEAVGRSTSGAGGPAEAEGGWWLNTAPMRWLRRGVEALTPVGRGAVSLVLGGATGVASMSMVEAGPGFQLLVLGVMVCIGALAAVPVLRKRSTAGFATETAIDWTLFTMAVFAAIGRVWDDVVAVTFPLAMITLLLGLLARRLGAGEGAAEPVGGGGRGAPPVGVGDGDGELRAGGAADGRAGMPG